MFCTDSRFHENKDFRMSSLCLHPRHWSGDWHLVGFQPPSAKRMKGVCAQKWLCDRGQGSCEPSTGLWQSSGQQAGVLDGPPGCPASQATSQGHVDPRRLKWPVRDRRVATRTPGPICASPTCDRPSGHAAVSTRKEEGHPRIHRATEAE